MADLCDFCRFGLVKISFATIMLTSIFALAIAICSEPQAASGQQFANNQLANYQQMLAQQQLLAAQNPSLAGQNYPGSNGGFPPQNLNSNAQLLGNQQFPSQQPFPNQLSTQQQLANQQLSAQMLAAQQNPQALGQQFPSQLPMPQGPPAANLPGQMQMLSEKNGILSPNELLALQSQQPRVCTSAMLMQIQSVCIRDLQAMGVVNISPSASITGALTWDILRRRSRANFQQICSAFENWDRCILPYKNVCLFDDSIKLQITPVHETLQYVCRPPANSDILSNWDCLLAASTRIDQNFCEAQLSANYQGVPGMTPSLQHSYGNPVGDAYCSSLQTYVLCLKQPVKDQCGERIWSHIIQAYQKPAQVYMPYCTLSGNSATPAIMCIILSLASSLILHRS